MAVSPGGAPSPAQLRAAANALFASGGAAEDSVHTALAAQYPGALLRYILERRDKVMLSAALRSGFFSRELSSRLARENPSAPYPLRLMLNHPELAGSAASADSSAAASAAGDIAAALERWQFSVGIAYPFLRSTVIGMPRTADARISSFGTDGLAFYYRPADSLRMEQADFHHMILHCIFRHMVPPDGVIRPLWDLACDMACEFLRCELFPSGEGTDLRFAVAGALPEGTDRRSAAAIYKALMDLFDDELPELQRRFRRDDHRFWYERAVASDAKPLRDRGRNFGFGAGEEGEGDPLSRLREQVEERWQPLTEQFLPKKNAKRSFGLAPGSREERLILRQEGKHDFTRYLRRYSVLREEMQLDESSFDYIPYCYGLERYGNLPFIEPLEYTESYKIEELVIAIDTSGSCTLEIVERFLSEIQRILMQRENFFRKMHIHIVQCDSIIQDHTEISSPEQWKRYLKDLKIKGRGGTSFIPVFTLVEKLREQGRIKELKGLMYFTDGDGAYPPKRPDYETAFIFPTRESLERTYPDWIVPLCLES